jgi:hypothetical protein
VVFEPAKTNRATIEQAIETAGYEVAA